MVECDIMADILNIFPLKPYLFMFYQKFIHRSMINKNIKIIKHFFALSFIFYLETEI